MLNLGHTFAHALEAASDYALPHGQAVALGLTAALELSGLADEARPSRRCSRRLRRASTPIAPGRRFTATRRRRRDGAARAARRAGRPLTGVELPESDVRRALAASSRRFGAVRVEVLNGVNLDVLGRRDPDMYGGLSLNELESRIYEWAKELEVGVRCRQTNHEGQYVDWLHEMLRDCRRRRRQPGSVDALQLRRSATRSSCSTCRSSRCICRTSTSGRTGGAFP